MLTPRGCHEINNEETEQSRNQEGYKSKVYLRDVKKGITEINATFIMTGLICRIIAVIPITVISNKDRSKPFFNTITHISPHRQT
ncbi:MAG: hypothetical protein QW733_06425 [Desulfurococcaceae archaeon]